MEKLSISDMKYISLIRQTQYFNSWYGGKNASIPTGTFISHGTAHAGFHFSYKGSGEHMLESP